MKSYTHDWDVVALARQAPVVATVLRTDSLAEVAFEYRTLVGYVSAREPHPLQDEIRREAYETCVGILSKYSEWLFRRNLALLLVRDGCLFRGHFRSFAEFVEAHTEVSPPQAHKACKIAFMTLIFDIEGLRPVMPEGEMHEELAKLLPDHWIRAWSKVLDAAAVEGLDIDLVKREIHHYAEENPSARAKRSAGVGNIPALKSLSAPSKKSGRCHALQLGVESALRPSPLAPRLAELAAEHRTTPGAFALKALEHASRKGKKPPTNPEPAALSKILARAVPECAAGLQQAAERGIMDHLAKILEDRHRHLCGRRSEYERRVARRVASGKTAP